MSSDAKIAGLYAVTPDERDTRVLVARVEAALAGGARLVQYRNKTAEASLRFEQGRALLEVCRQRAVPMIVNDHLELALAIGADGVHLGVGDGSLAAARRQCGAHMLLGASCYDRLQDALDAERDGADYVAFGSFFASGVKPAAARAPLELLRDAKQKVAVPLVAIGGITPGNAPLLIAAGADCVAVISALFDAPDVKLSAQRFSALFNRSS